MDLNQFLGIKPFIDELSGPGSDSSGNKIEYQDDFVEKNSNSGLDTIDEDKMSEEISQNYSTKNLLSQRVDLQDEESKEPEGSITCSQKFLKMEKRYRLENRALKHMQNICENDIKN